MVECITNRSLSDIFSASITEGPNVYGLSD
ncbi:MAG: hypothetical protein ACJATF_002174 [Flavobacteriales bacterium]